MIKDDLLLKLMLCLVFHTAHHHLKLLYHPPLSVTYL